MVNGTFTSKLTQVNTFLCKVCTSILVYRYYLSPDSCVQKPSIFLLSAVSLKIFCTLNQFHVLPAWKACAEIPAASKKSREQRHTRLLLQSYYYSRTGKVRKSRYVRKT